MRSRNLLYAVLPIAVAVLDACVASDIVAPVSDAGPISTTPVLVATDLLSGSIVARAPMRDTATLAVLSGHLIVTGVLNQSAPCFALTSVATRTGSHLVVRLVATEVSYPCFTFVAGAFDYVIAFPGLGTGDYDVDVSHRLQLPAGRVMEFPVASGRVHVP